MSLHQTPIITLLIFTLLATTIHSSPNNHLQLPSARKLGKDDSLYCQSWRFSVETNDAGTWTTIPPRCVNFVESYMDNEPYESDSNIVAYNALEFAKLVNVLNDGKDCWVFDIDETLLTSLPYYQLHGFGSEVFNETSYDEWASLAVAPALPASLHLYKELQQLGFTIFLLTGRDEPTRSYTEKNLRNAGYSNWKKLILRGPSDRGKLAIEYKSENRQELIDEGYRIHGSSGDQWSDLLGFAVAQRSFKLPNIMYYIP